MQDIHINSKKRIFQCKIWRHIIWQSFQLFRDSSFYRFFCTRRSKHDYLIVPETNHRILNNYKNLLGEIYQYKANFESQGVRFKGKSHFHMVSIEYDGFLGEMQMNQDLQYSIVDADKIEGEGKITNISLKKGSKKWNMAVLDDFLIFTLKFAAPSFVNFIDMKGHNTHIITLIFKDQQEKFILEKEFQFSYLDQSKVIEIWQRPLTTIIDVKLINSHQDRKKLGLGYLNFLGKCIAPKPSGPSSIIGGASVVSKVSVASKKPQEKIPISINIDDDEVDRILDLDADPLDTIHKHAQDIYFQEDEPPHTDGQSSRGKTPNQSVIANSAINSFHDSRSVRSHALPERQHTQASTRGRQSVHPIEIQLDTFIEPAFGQEARELTQQELATAILQEPSKEPYVTYDYDAQGQWWNILRMVRKDWVLAQSNVQNQKEVKSEYRMSTKISVQHLYRRCILVEGFQKQRKDMNQQTALNMGATILRQVQPGCIVVTSRQYGEKIKRMKKFKNTKLVTEEYILNCKRFDRLLNEDDYMIR